MQILTSKQYNQGIGKSKLLTNSGVGAIITTRMGYYILVSDISKWEFVRKTQRLVKEIRGQYSESEWYLKSKDRALNEGVRFIDDQRFVRFLRLQKAITNLTCLIEIPSMSLSEPFNFPKWDDHPIKRKLEDDRAKAEDFMVIGTHFPKWFINDGGYLKQYEQWKSLWIQKKLGLERFAPPRDASKRLKDADGNEKSISYTTEHSGKVTIDLYATLTQTNLILICQNGHLSDIPWPKFLRWKSSGVRDNGENLFALDGCCPTPKLVWTESKTKSEGYSSIYIECENCGCGSGKDGKAKITLEGINNLRPRCIGEKPWEMDLQDGVSIVPHEKCTRLDTEVRQNMQVSLVTGNNVYYSNGFASLYIPLEMVENRSKELIEAKAKCEEKYKKYIKVTPNLTKELFWDSKIDIDDFLIENDFHPIDKKIFESQLKEYFLEAPAPKSVDDHETYRLQEYKCFVDNNKVNQSGLKFEDIVLPKELEAFFIKIQQVEELKVTYVQMDFTRVKPKERIRIDDQIVISTTGQNIFSVAESELYVLPATEALGEGIFFQFNDKTIDSWLVTNKNLLGNRYKSFEKDLNLNSQGAATKQRIKNNGYKHFLIHTFSHILMRELEFTCGYPTASLKERLYISQEMSGVLIYTSEGSEGSMGGLVWQGQTQVIKMLIAKALSRAIECSSDPLCWQSEGQGILDLNLAACFSCSLTSETACEEFNLGLDRRPLVDPDFGYFSPILDD